VPQTHAKIVANINHTPCVCRWQRRTKGISLVSLCHSGEFTLRKCSHFI